MKTRQAPRLRTRAVPLPAAIGCIAAEQIVPYPPGVPVLSPGERISWAKLILLARMAAAGAVCTGAADSRLLTIQVVEE